MVSRRRTVKRSRKGSRNGSRKQRGGEILPEQKSNLYAKINELTTYMNTLPHDDGKYKVLHNKIKELNTYFLHYIL